MPVCSECGNEFTPHKFSARRTFCYRQKCIDAVERRRNQTKIDRVSQLRRKKDWSEHVRQVKGIGKGNAWKVKTDLFRTCLKCGKRFEVPIDTDWHICPGCQVKNARLREECNDGALGLYSNSIVSDTTLGDGSKRLSRKGPLY
jgi:hypothetical protein